MRGTIVQDKYFADERDFLKYDLWIKLARYLGDSVSLTFIPMLTKDDGKKQGNKTNYKCGDRSPELYEFLQGSLNPEDRRTIRLRDFFGKHLHRLYHPYRDDSSQADYFHDGCRESYFREIPEKWLTNSLILIDPDIGLETKSSYWKKHPEKYVRYCEVAGIARRSAGNRAIVVVQFPLRDANRRKEGLKFRADELKKSMTEWNVHWIAPQTANGKVGDVAFFVLTPGFGNRTDVSDFLRHYGQCHQMTTDDEQSVLG
jgi:hypothetical protein